MNTQIIKGRQIRNEILEKVKKEVEELSFQPVFCDVLVGDDPASIQYINMKARTAESVGIKFHYAKYPKDITTEELVIEIKKLNQIENMCGLIVQLPVPDHIDKDSALNAIDKDIDVDFLSENASRIFYEKDTTLGFPAGLACVNILDSLDIDLSLKKIVVIGQGMLVGRPVTHLLKNRGLDIEIVTKNMEDKKDIIKNADIIISATGDGKFITGDMIKEGVIIIDAGTSESNGSIVGDVDTESVLGIASHISPVPGGVGPVTVATLLQNVLAVAKLKDKIK